MWTWGLLFVLAFTAFSLNLYREVFYPVMSTVSQVTPTPFNLRTPRPKHDPIEPSVTYAQILDRAREEGAKRGWSEPVGALTYNQRYGIYSARFFQPGDDHGAAGVGPAMLFYDGRTGATSAIGSPGSARRPTSSCRRSSRCIPAASWGCPAAS